MGPTPGSSGRVPLPERAMKRLIPGAALIAAVFLLSLPAAASMVRPSTLEAMTEGSGLVVLGQPVSSRSYWEDGRIYTSTLFAVEEVLKNAVGETAGVIEIKYLGGESGGVTMTVDGAPHLEPGQRMILFLNKVKEFYVVYALHYGANTLVPGPDGAEEVRGPVFDDHESGATAEREKTAPKAAPKPAGRAAPQGRMARSSLSGTAVSPNRDAKAFRQQVRDLSGGADGPVDKGSAK